MSRIVHGRKVGILGGSFDPPHAGHVNITLEALKRFDLDEIWWMISPGNPMKEMPPAPLAKRIEAAMAIMQHPRVRISDFEARHALRFTAETLRTLQQHHQGAKFVWLMGADNLAGFHKWQDWRWIINNVPIGVLARPGQRISARMSKTANIFRKFRLPERHSRDLANHSAPAWCFLNVPMRHISSTDIRNSGRWERS